MRIHRVAGATGALEVTSLAAMLTRADLRLGGRTVRPFAVAPWWRQALPDDVPGHVRVLGGDFVAVPFGSAAAGPGMDPEWVGIAPIRPPHPQHGWSAEGEWRVEATTDDSITLALDQPGSGITRLRRTIRLHRARPRIEFELEVLPLIDLELPVALHPILALPRSGALRLDVDAEVGFTHPVPTAHSVAAPWRRFASLDAVPARDGGTIRLSTIPPAEAAGAPVEQVVQLFGLRGPVKITRPDAVRIEVDWDRSLLPSLQLWVSDRGIDEAPWSSRYRGLGVEPMVGAFDFGADAASDNPLRRLGHPTTLPLRAGEPLLLRSSVEVVPPA